MICNVESYIITIITTILLTIISIPLFGNVSFSIKRILSDFNLNTIFRIDSVRQYD